MNVRDRYETPPILDGEMREILSRGQALVQVEERLPVQLCAMCRCTLRVVPETRTTRLNDGTIVCAPCERLLRLQPARAGVPERFARIRLDSPVLQQIVGGAAIVLARKALDAEGVTLSGPAGTGKTTLAVAMYQHILDLGAGERATQAETDRARGARFKSAYQLAKARSQYPLGAGEAPDVQEAMDATLLVIDELGSEKDSATNAVGDVIYERHARLRPTWVTTWLTKPDLDKRYGSGIARRLLERAAVIPLARTEEAAPQMTRGERPSLAEHSRPREVSRLDAERVPRPMAAAR